MVCGSDGTVKSFIADLLLEQREERVDPSSVRVMKGKVSGYQVTLVEMPALSNTRLSEQEVMRQTLHSVSVCDPGIHAFIISVPVGTLTDEDKSEIQTIQRIFGPRVNDHTVILFTHPYDTNEAAAKYVEQSYETEQLRSMCGGRFIILKKKHHSFKHGPTLLEQVTEFVTKTAYSLLMYVEAQTNGVKQELENRLTEMEKTIQLLRANQKQTSE